MLVKGATIAKGWGAGGRKFSFDRASKVFERGRDQVGLICGREVKHYIFICSKYFSKKMIKDFFNYMKL